MEYVDGGSLEEMLRREGRLSLADAVHIALACARALQHAHQLNLVHRDVKPDNVLLTRDGQIKLADLGLAKSQDDSLNLTRLGSGVGTPLYMPPEQARGSRHVDARSDIFALGCMLYRMLTGTLPYKGESLVDLIVAKEEDSFPRPWQHNPSIPDRLDRIVARMLAGDPKRRFPSCAELIKQLEALKLAGRKLSLQTDY
jgi:serine/threonine-protein kinase